MSKTLMITGASRGIGAAIASKFASEGYNISMCCQNSGQELKDLAQELSSKYQVKVQCFIGDVADYAFIKSMVDTSLKELGPIDVLVNNAGVSYVGLLTDMTIEDWNKIIGTNLTSVFNTCSFLVPEMVKQQRGKIINISSVWGNVGASCEVAYSASKGGINSFTKALGKELAPSNIQVNAIACGCIDTQMNACFTAEERQELANEIPAGRFGLCSEVAHLVYQLSEDNTYLNGQIITLDGGWI